MVRGPSSSQVCCCVQCAHCTAGDQGPGRSLTEPSVNFQRHPTCLVQHSSSTAPAAQGTPRPRCSTTRRETDCLWSVWTLLKASVYNVYFPSTFRRVSDVLGPSQNMYSSCRHISILAPLPRARPPYQDAIYNMDHGTGAHHSFIFHSSITSCYIGIFDTASRMEPGGAGSRCLYPSTSAINNNIHYQQRCLPFPYIAGADFAAFDIAARYQR